MTAMTGQISKLTVRHVGAPQNDRRIKSLMRRLETGPVTAGLIPSALHTAGQYANSPAGAGHGG
jgi:hypothetical protein